MKPLPMVGVLLVVFGAFVVFKGLTYKSQSDVVKIGDLEISAEQRRSIPTWVGVVGMVGGLLLIAGVGRRRGG
jgi:hypothetical protein